MRKTCPDPKIELLASLALANFGYPYFDGVSKSDCTAVLHYEKDGKIFRVAAVRADESSSLSKYAKKMKIPHMRADSWLILGEGLPEGGDLKDYWEYAVKTARQIEIADFSITLYPNCSFPEEFKSFENLLNQAESVKFSVRIFGESINVKCKLKAEAQSPLARLFNSMPCRGKSFEESRFVKQDAAITIITKINPLAEFPKEIEMHSACAGLVPENIVKSRGLFKGTGTWVIDAGTALSVYASERSVNDIKASYQSGFAECSTEENKLKAGLVDGFEIIETGGKHKTFISAYGGFEAASNSLPALLGALMKIKSHPAEDCPLKRFGNKNSEIVAVLNAEKFIEQFIPTSIKFNRLPQIVFDITALRDSIELGTVLHYDNLKAALILYNEYIMAQNAAEGRETSKIK